MSNSVQNIDSPQSDNGNNATANSSDDESVAPKMLSNQPNKSALQPKSVTSTTNVLIIVLSILGGTIGGAGIVKYGPAPQSSSQIKILDFDRLLKIVDIDSPNAKENARNVAIKAKIIAKMYADQGIVVVDRAVVIEAPEDAYIEFTP